MQVPRFEPRMNKFRNKNLKIKKNETECYRGTFGEFQVELIDLFEDAFGILQSQPACLGQASQTVPLITNELATGVHWSRVVVIQGAATDQLVIEIRFN